MITEKDVLDAILNIKTHTKYGPYYIFTAGTGFPCKMIIEFHKNDGDIIVVDRKNRMWRKGVRYDNVTKIK